MSGESLHSAESPPGGAAVDAENLYHLGILCLKRRFLGSGGTEKTIVAPFLVLRGEASEGMAQWKDSLFHLAGVLPIRCEGMVRWSNASQGLVFEAGPLSFGVSSGFRKGPCGHPELCTEIRIDFANPW